MDIQWLIHLDITNAGDIVAAAKSCHDVTMSVNNSGVGSPVILLRLIPGTNDRFE